MKTGKSISELAAEIERQQNTKRDFVARTDKINLFVDQGETNNVALDLGGGEVFPISDLAHEQIGAHVGIPKPYYDRMRAEVPTLLTDNIKTWFDRKPAARLIRTMDGRDRAFLSDSFRPLDNYDFAEAILPTLLDNNLVIMSAEITEKRLYIKAVDPRITRDVPTGRHIGDGSHTFFDTLSPAIVASNSEVGYGRLSVEWGVYTKVCTNMATIPASGMKRTHVGARHALTDSVENIDKMLTSETRKATDRAIFLQVRDVVKAAFDEATFAAHCAKIANMAQDPVEDVVKTVELSAKKFGLSDMVARTVQKHMIEGGDLTRMGLFNAITRTAQDQADYDYASDLERLGGKIIDLTKGEWKELALAA